MLIRYGDSPQLSQFTVACNTGDGGLFSNISANLAKGYPKFKESPRTEQAAIVCGSGPSLADSLESIRAMKQRGGKIFALNGVAKFLSENDIKADVHIIVDPRPHNLDFVEQAWAGEIWLASQCHPSLFEQCEKIGYPVKLWHPGINGIQDRIPAKQSLLIGGGITVGLCGLCLIHAAGHREMHLFGYDSCHKDNKGHAFRQDRNKNDELVTATVDNQQFTCSIGMASQAHEWPRVYQMLLDEGCEVYVHGDGFIPALWKSWQREKAQRVLTAVYDLGLSPPSRSFHWFLHEAELKRVEGGYDFLDIVFQPGPMHGFKSDTDIKDVAKLKDTLWNICVSRARELQSVRNIEVLRQRKTISGDVFPDGYAENSPKSHHIHDTPVLSVVKNTNRLVVAFPLQKNSGNFPSEKQAMLLIRSIRKNMPQAWIVHVTDDQYPAIDGVDEVFRKSKTGDFIEWMFFALSDICKRGDNVMVVGTDVIFRGDVSELFNLEFDVASCRYPFPRYQNYDIAAYCTDMVLVKPSAPHFYDQCVSFYRAHPEIQDGWEGGQDAFLAVSYDFKMLDLDFNTYCMTPESADDDLSKAAIVHYRGPRKRWMGEHGVASGLCTIDELPTSEKTSCLA